MPLHTIESASCYGNTAVCVGSGEVPAGRDEGVSSRGCGGVLGESTHAAIGARRPSHPGAGEGNLRAHAFRKSEKVRASVPISRARSSAETVS